MINPDPAYSTLKIKTSSKSETSIQDLFRNIWLARYLRPQFNDFNNWNVGKLIRNLKKMSVQENYGIKPKLNSRYNQKANANI
jgi:hypothetical protein